MKASYFILVICSLLIVSLSGMAQTTSITPVKESVITTNKIAPATIDKSIMAEAQSQVVVTTSRIDNITSTTATCYYSVLFKGLTMGTDIKAAIGGVCVSKSTNPTVANTKFGTSKNCSSLSNACSDLTGLTPNMKYYVRAYYTITQGTVTGTFYGSELSFTTKPTAK